MLHKEDPKTVIYREYKTFSLETFRSELFSKHELQENNDYQTFEKSFVGASKKSKIFRGNQKSHMNKTLRNTIIKQGKI